MVRLTSTESSQGSCRNRIFGQVRQKANKSGEKPGGGVFCCKFRYKSLIQNCLAVGYHVHFARFCTTFCSRCLPIGFEKRPLGTQTGKFVLILCFLEVILCKKAQRQLARVHMGLPTD